MENTPQKVVEGVGKSPEKLCTNPGCGKSGISENVVEDST